MNMEDKKRLFDEIKEMLSKKESCTDIKDTSDEKNYKCEFTVCNGVTATLSLLKSGDMLKVVGKRVFKDISDKELYDTAMIITNGTGINFTTYQNTITLQKIFVFANMENEEEIKKSCFDCVASYVNVLEENLELLKITGKEKVLNSPVQTNSKENADKNQKVESVKESKNKEDFSEKVKDNETHSLNEEVVEDADLGSSCEDNNQNSNNVEEDDIEKEDIEENDAEEKSIEAEDNKELTHQEDSTDKDTVDNVSDDTGKVLPENTTNSINYERAPSVLKQMEDMYAEMDRVFEQRKKRADYREDTLNELAKTLKEKEAHVEMLMKDKDKIFEEKENEYNRKMEEIEIARRKLDFDKKAFKEEKEAFEREKAAFEDMMKLKEKVNS